MTFYIFIYGSTATGTGKTVFTSSLGYILSTFGLNVNIIKFDGLMNISFKTMMESTKNGEIIWEGDEVFKTKDGTLVDSDIGTYERFLEKNLSSRNNLINGKFYEELIRKEKEGKFKKGDFLNINKNIIPKYKEEVKKQGEVYDVCLVEIGGTLGDEDTRLFKKSLKAIKNEGIDCLTICYSYLPKKPRYNLLSSKEPFLLKTVKQDYEKASNSHLSPDILAIRSDEQLKEEHKKRIKRDTFLPKEKMINIISSENIYEIPKNILSEQALKEIKKFLNISKKRRKKGHLEKYLEIPIKEISNILVIGNNESSGSQISLKEAIKHGAKHVNKKAKINWCSEREINKIKIKKQNFIVLMEADVKTQKKIHEYAKSPVLYIGKKPNVKKFHRIKKDLEYRSKPMKPILAEFFKKC